MNKAVEDRARAQCAIDLRLSGVRDARIPALVDRLWPVVAREMMGVMDAETLTEPADLLECQAIFRELARQYQDRQRQAEAGWPTAPWLRGLLQHA